MRRSRNWGFTLIEMLCVLGIILVLCGIAFPVTAMMRNSAKHTVCASNLYQLALGIHLYAGDNDGLVPPATTDETFFIDRGVPPELVKQSPADLRADLAPYITDDSIWFCPSDQFARTSKFYMGQHHELTSYHFLPFDQDRLKSATWPPHMALTKSINRTLNAFKDAPLIADAYGFSHINFELPDANNAISNHPDNYVNAIRQDMSLFRSPADVLFSLPIE